MDFKRSGVTKNQHLDNRWANKDKPRALVAEDLNKLLDQHLLQAAKHFVPSMIQSLAVYHLDMTAKCS